MAVKKKTLSGSELLTRLQGWIRQGLVEEHYTLGDYSDGRRVKHRYYTMFCDPRRFYDDECGPFPPADMMVKMAGAMIRAGEAIDEKWPAAMFRPVMTLDSVWVDICMEGANNPAGAFERHARLQTMETWARQKRITIDFFVNNQKTRSTAVVKFGQNWQYERCENAESFPSPEMVANIALALNAGVDQK